MIVNIYSHCQFHEGVPLHIIFFHVCPVYHTVIDAYLLNSSVTASHFIYIPYRYSFSKICMIKHHLNQVYVTISVF